jgi:hypothetical protein
MVQLMLQQANRNPKAMRNLLSWEWGRRRGERIRISAIAKTMAAMRRVRMLVWGTGGFYWVCGDSHLIRMRGEVLNRKRRAEGRWVGRGLENRFYISSWDAMRRTSATLQA